MRTFLFIFSFLSTLCTISAQAELNFRKTDSFKALFSNQESFEQTLELIESAEKHLDLAYFIYSDDYSASYLSDVLIRKAKSGVKIRILVDWAMIQSHRNQFKAMMAVAGENLQVAYFRPLPEGVKKDLELLGIDDSRAFLKALSTMDPAALRGLLNKNGNEKFFSIERLFKVWLTGLQKNLLREEPERKTEIKKAKLRARDWLAASMRLHHKLILSYSDTESKLLGGGRNIEDSYFLESDHAIRVEQGANAKYAFMDETFVVESEALVRQAKTTFDFYWQSAAWPKRVLNHELVELENTGLSKEALEKAHAQIKDKAKKFAEHLIPSDPTNPDGPKQFRQKSKSPVIRKALSTNNISVAYSEVALLPNRNSITKKEYAEPSAFHQNLTQLMDKVPAGEEILIHNAYIFFPESLQWTLMNAIKRGVRVTIQTNSPESSDLGFIAALARAQYRYLLQLGAKYQVKNHLGKLVDAVQILEYHTSESLHAKTFVLGNRYLVISSINADPRCELLDTGNGIFVGDNTKDGIVAQYWKQFGEFQKRLFKTERTVKSGKKTKLLKRVTLKTLDVEKKLRHQALEQKLNKKEISKKQYQLSLEVENQFSKLVGQSFEEEAKGPAQEARAFLTKLMIQL